MLKYIMIKEMIILKEQTKKKILLAFISIITIVVLVVTLKIYENRENNLLSISKINNYLTEIKYEEIATHVVEQPNTIIYVSNSSKDESIKCENIFKEVIKKYNLENEIIYININRLPYKTLIPHSPYHKQRSFFLRTLTAINKTHCR